MRMAFWWSENRHVRGNRKLTNLAIAAEFLASRSLSNGLIAAVGMMDELVYLSTLLAGCGYDLDRPYDD